MKKRGEKSVAEDPGQPAGILVSIVPGDHVRVLGLDVDADVASVTVHGPLFQTAKIRYLDADGCIAHADDIPVSCLTKIPHARPGKIGFSAFHHVVELDPTDFEP